MKLKHIPARSPSGAEANAEREKRLEAVKPVCATLADEVEPRRGVKIPAGALVKPELFQIMTQVMSMKTFRLGESARLGVHPATVARWLRRNVYRGRIAVRRKNARVVTVKLKPDFYYEGHGR